MPSSTLKKLGQQWLRFPHDSYRSNQQTINRYNHVILTLSDGTLLVLCDVFQNMASGEITKHPIKTEDLEELNT